MKKNMNNNSIWRRVIINRSAKREGVPYATVPPVLYGVYAITNDSGLDQDLYMVYDKHLSTPTRCSARVVFEDGGSIRLEWNAKTGELIESSRKLLARYGILYGVQELVYDFGSIYQDEYIRDMMPRAAAAAGDGKRKKKKVWSSKPVTAIAVNLIPYENVLAPKKAPSKKKSAKRGKDDCPYVVQVSGYWRDGKYIEPYLRRVPIPQKKSA